LWTSLAIDRGHRRPHDDRRLRLARDGTQRLRRRVVLAEREAVDPVPDPVPGEKQLGEHRDIGRRRADDLGDPRDVSGHVPRNGCELAEEEAHQ